MDQDAIALFQQLADYSPSERENYYAEHRISAAVRLEVESLLRFDRESGHSLTGHVAAAAEKALAGGAIEEASQKRTAGRSTSQGHATIPSRSVDEGRFPAGTVLGGRYRIITLLGRGGMGEVYRANDLTLNQSVALKFLPPAVARDQRRVARFHGEVRMARRISHPNVCRVYDIGEFNGIAYISMEYIAGEDLASLLRRIGRLPPDKAVEIARRLCAGLAAAHDKGVVHRDFKPENVMIDNRGQVLITDFGLAGLPSELTGSEVRNGTPAYMAPEQLDGRGVSTRSDIYALGLVLYEMFTGKKVFENPLERGVPPSSIWTVLKDIDPAVTRTIEHCLAPDPRDRPASALAVAAALPGGNPLAEALAAGRTPSPQMVAASLDTGTISVRTATLIMGMIAVGLVSVVLLGSRVSVVHVTPFEHPPDVLAQKAREVIGAFGYTGPSTDRAYDYFFAGNYRRYAETRETPAEYQAQLARGQPPLVYFWYRQSPQYLEPFNAYFRVSQFDPPVVVAGEVLLWLDQRGRLLNFQAAPPREDYSHPSERDPEWGRFFSAAGLDRERFTPTVPQWIPPITFDARAAWTGTFEDATPTPVRIEAAAWKGRPVYFRIIGPWTEFQGIPIRSSIENAVDWVGIGLIVIVLAAATFIAWRNYGLGRGDLRGSSRLAAIALIITLFRWFLDAHHLPTFAESLSLFLALGSALCSAVIYWVLYMTIEPFVRRRRPQSLITWTRLLAGGIRDPLVGGHILAGVALGIGFAIWSTLQSFLLLERGAVPLHNLWQISVLRSAGSSVSAWLYNLEDAVTSAQGLFVLFLLLLAVVRRKWAATVLFVLLIAVPSLSSNHPLIDAAYWGVQLGLVPWIVLRFGLLPMTVAFFVSYVLKGFPLTADFSAWYASTTLFALVTVLTLAVWSYRIALAGRPLLQGEILETS
jgi:serine/threonine-protein kinase